MYKDNVNTHINKKAARCCQIRQSEGMPKLSTPFSGDISRDKCHRLNCFRISTSMVAFFAYSQVSQRRILFISMSTFDTKGRTLDTKGRGKFLRFHFFIATDIFGQFRHKKCAADKEKTLSLGSTFTRCIPKTAQAKGLFETEIIEWSVKIYRVVSLRIKIGVRTL